MKYTKQTSIGGKWAKGSELGEVKRAKIVSETEPVSSQFQNKDGSVKMQDVCKVRFDGVEDALNVSLNRATINGLIDAFGEDSKEWQSKVLSVETEKIRVAGKAVVALYLIPEGYERTDDDNGFVVIVKKGVKVEKAEGQVDDLPF